MELGTQLGSGAKKEQIVATSALVSSDEESGISEDGGMEGGNEDGIRKTVRIEQRKS